MPALTAKEILQKLRYQSMTEDEIADEKAVKMLQKLQT